MKRRRGAPRCHDCNSPAHLVVDASGNRGPITHYADLMRLAIVKRSIPDGAGYIDNRPGSEVPLKESVGLHAEFPEVATGFAPREDRLREGGSAGVDIANINRESLPVQDPRHGTEVTSKQILGVPGGDEHGGAWRAGDPPKGLT